MSDNDRAPSATEGPPAGGGWRELIEDAAESHAAAQSLVALLLGDLERSERYKVELLERVSSAERRAAESEAGAAALREVLSGFYEWLTTDETDTLPGFNEVTFKAAARTALDGTTGKDLLARLDAAERRAADRDEMFQRQAAAVRHHTDRADALERRAAELTSVLAFVTDWQFDKAIEKFRELQRVAESLGIPDSDLALLQRYCGWLQGIRDQVAPFSDHLQAEREGWDAKFRIIDEQVAQIAALRQMALALIWVAGPEVREIAWQELNNEQAGAEFLARLLTAERRAAELESQIAVSEQAWTKLLADVETASTLAAEDYAALYQQLQDERWKADRICLDWAEKLDAAERRAAELETERQYLNDVLSALEQRHRRALEWAWRFRREARAAQAELAYTTSWAHACGGNLTHMDGVAVELREQNATLNSHYEDALSILADLRSDVLCNILDDGYCAAHDWEHGPGLPCPHQRLAAFRGDWRAAIMDREGQP